LNLLQIDGLRGGRLSVREYISIQRDGFSRSVAQYEIEGCSERLPARSSLKRGLVLRPSHRTRTTPRSSEGIGKCFQEEIVCRFRQPIVTAALLFGAAAVLSHAQTFTILASPDFTNGNNPSTPNGAVLVQGPDGNFYGTTGGGGVDNGGCGTVYQLTPSGTITTLHSFNYDVDGCDPTSGLILASDGNLYGTTAFTIFKITLGGAFSLLYTQVTGGPHLLNAMVQARDGNFYGTSSEGGANEQGTIFRMTPSGALTVLLNFPNPQIGTAPKGPLIQASDGNLYSTTSDGGAGSSGTVFKITLSGTASVLYAFCTNMKSGTCLDGSTPWNGLLQANDGNLYGTTQAGGTSGPGGHGTIFKLTLGGALTTLYSFCPQASCPDGNTPIGALIQGKDGNFYGVNTSGGMFNQAGTVFQLTPSGQLTTLHQFCSQTECVDGSNPEGALLQGSDGTLYGATNSDGPNSFGTIFSLKLPAAPAYTCTNTTPPTITSIDSASAYGGYAYFASGSWLEIKGANLADPNDPRLASGSAQWASADFNGPNAPTNLDGISVSINNKPAYISYLSPTQLNVQAPEDSTNGNVAITVTNCKATSSITMFSRRSLAPGLLAPPNYSSGGTSYLVATFASDGAYVLNTSLGASFGLNSRPAKPGDVIVAYGIGFGDVTPTILPGVIVGQSNALIDPVTFSFGSAPATLAYAGLAGNFVGLYEFFINVPLGLANGDYQINVAQNGTIVPQIMYLTVHN
jgi:uncharacterized protein (TIGR03437 family)